jgi:hypothetical protein
MTTTWLTFEEARVHLRTCRQRLRAAVRRGEHDAWVNKGSAARPRYAFDGNLIDDWWREVCRAFASEDRGSTRSAGTRSTGAPARASARASLSLASSRTRSKQSAPSEEIGDLVTLARTAAQGTS